jgi:hypothetical protein
MKFLNSKVLLKGERSIVRDGENDNFNEQPYDWLMPIGKS